MKKTIILLFFISTGSLALVHQSIAQTKYSEKVAATVDKALPDSLSMGSSAKWSYNMSMVLKGYEGLWMRTGNVGYYNSIKSAMDYFVQHDGTVKMYDREEYNIDYINNGTLVLLLYRVTGAEKYKKAATHLRDQLRIHPRINENGFRHTKIHNNQMWLQGLFMSAPFYTEYAMRFHDDSAFNDIANQFLLMEKHARDPKTGLLYHAWDENKQEKWANKETGASPLFWATAMGWYCDALVDALDYFPSTHPKRKNLIAILNRLVNAIEKQQEPATGLWYNIVNYNGLAKEKNNFDVVASSQFVYTIAKGVRKEYLPVTKLAIAKKGYDGIVKRFIKEENGQTNLHGTVKASDRNGSFEYYKSEQIIVNDPKAVATFLLAAGEMEMLPTQSIGKGKNILLDRWFNSEKRKDATAAEQYWHYTWEERSHPGYYTLGTIFERYGATLKSLDVAPTANNLSKASVYVIVDPDHIKDNPKPNYITATDVTVISNWVNAGGVLVIMANDSNNCDLPHLNLLTNKFGITFTNSSLNMVKNDTYIQGEVLPGANNPVFKTTKRMFLKELSQLTVKAPAKALVTKDNAVIIAVAKYGKGTVFAVGDPWVYNEYIDNRKLLPPEFENYKAAEDLVKWLLQNATKK